MKSHRKKTLKYKYIQCNTTNKRQFKNVLFLRMEIFRQSSVIISLSDLQYAQHSSYQSIIKKDFGYLSTFVTNLVFYSMQSCAIVVDYNQHDVPLFIR